MLRAACSPRFTKSGPGASSGLVDRLFPQSQLLQPAPASTGTPRPQASESTAPQVGRGHGFSDVRGSPPRRSHAVARATRPAARVPTSPPRQSRVQQAVSSPGRRQLLAAQAAAIVPRADVKTTGTDVDAIPVLVRDVNDGSAVQEAGRSRQLADDIRCRARFTLLSTKAAGCSLIMLPLPLLRPKSLPKTPCTASPPCPHVHTRTHTLARILYPPDKVPSGNCGAR